MKFYVASSFQNINQVRTITKELIQIGGHLSYDWTLNERADSIEDLQRIGSLEKAAIEDSELVIIVLPGGNGTHIELGLAIAGKKKIILFSPDHKIMDAETSTTFYHLPEIEKCFGSIEKCIDKVKFIFPS
ncbi:MAG: group-specific protein [Paenisporosarcina sp.]